MNSRRLMGTPSKRFPIFSTSTSECHLVHHSKIRCPMSALGQKQTSAHVRVMSFPSKADIGGRGWDVREVPKAGMASGKVPDSGNNDGSTMLEDHSRAPTF